MTAYDVTLQHRLARRETNLCAVAYIGLVQDVFLQAETSFLPVTAWRVQLTNQHAWKWGVGICDSTVALYGRKAELCLMEYILARRVTAEQSAYDV